MEEEKIIKGQPKSFLKKIKENVDDHDEMLKTDQVITGGENNYSDNYYLFRKKLAYSRRILKDAGAHYVINNLVDLKEIINNMNMHH